MHVIPIASSDPTPLCSVWFGLVVVVCFLFVCLLLFWFGLILMGLLTGLCIGPLPALEAIDELTALHANYNSPFWLRLNVYNDLAKAMKELPRRANGTQVANGT